MIKKLEETKNNRMGDYKLPAKTIISNKRIINSIIEIIIKTNLK